MKAAPSSVKRAASPIAACAVSSFERAYFQAADVAERQNQSPGRSFERRARFPLHCLLAFNARRLALERVDCELMVGRQDRAAGGQELEAQMLEIERADPQSVANARQHRRSHRGLPDELHVALRGDQRVERVEEDADRSREPHALALFSRPLEQEGARRLQLLRKRRLLADRRAVGRSEILIGIENACNRSHVDRELADGFAGDHSASTGVGKDRGQEREGDIGEAPRGE